MRNRPPLFGIGLFFGVLLGSFLFVVIHATDTAEATEPERERPPPREQTGPSPQARARLSIAKVHFMKKFVAALTGEPRNQHANPDHQVLLADPSKPLVCLDCHAADGVDVTRMLKLDPGTNDPFVRRLRVDPNFMIPLMTAWVDRLNQRHAAHLVKPVTCTDCHAVNPREKFDVYPALMVSFVEALRKPPRNKHPASRWKPLLKDPDTPGLLCGQCHEAIGVDWERVLQRRKTPLPRPDKYADNKGFMINLMEDWVERANRDTKDLLVKTLVCLDCHETDARR